ncbi:hypothetical protein SISSUDRAFT_1067813 [Sistotremastrum suecicum HHB10207 ss-3]|uniref:Uncharacterized protein n=1 Tax=Sistotremastrum suecicum HHB10207 ss-3 TaxID=1314776 RepID=A0A165WNT4_9AGAM|nr:hypothetical protein SISSUDRAFT_1067813 [Sistotremastrum suecicum HHB10207 ss-3]
MRWTDDEQLPWLDSRVIAYQDAKDRSSAAREVFLNEVYAEFVEQWPLEEVVFDKVIGCKTNTPEEIVIKREAALRASTALRPLVRKSYPRHDLEGRFRKTEPHAAHPRRPQATNAYATLYGKEKELKRHVDEYYKAYVDGLPPNAPKKRRVTVRDEVLKMLYRQEEQLVKSEVESFRSRELPGVWLNGLAADASEDEKDEAYVKYILGNQRLMPAACKLVVENLKKMTGMNVVMLLGGQDFREGGKLSVSVFDAGVTYLTRSQPSQSLPKAETEELVRFEKVFSQFNQKTWPMELREKRRATLHRLSKVKDGLGEVGDKVEASAEEDESLPKAGSESRVKPKPRPKKKSTAGVSPTPSVLHSPTQSSHSFSPRSLQLIREKKDAERLKKFEETYFEGPDAGAGPGDEILWTGDREGSWKALDRAHFALMKAANVERVKDLPADKAWVDDYKATRPSSPSHPQTAPNPGTNLGPTTPAQPVPPSGSTPTSPTPVITPASSIPAGQMSNTAPTSSSVEPSGVSTVPVRSDEPVTKSTKPISAPPVSAPPQGNVQEGTVPPQADKPPAFVPSTNVPSRLPAASSSLSLSSPSQPPPIPLNTTPPTTNPPISARTLPIVGEKIPPNLVL